MSALHEHADRTVDLEPLSADSTPSPLEVPLTAITAVIDAAYVTGPVAVPLAVES